MTCLVPPGYSRVVGVSTKADIDVTDPETYEARVTHHA
jgi:hypothetical protein